MKLILVHSAQVTSVQMLYTLYKCATFDDSPPPLSLEIAAKLTTFPDQLAAEDVEDFVSLAKYYSGTRTPTLACICREPML